MTDTKRMTDVSKQDLAEAFKLLDTPLLKPEGPTSVQLMDERDPEGPVVFKDKDGKPYLWLPQETYRAIMEWDAPASTTPPVKKKKEEE